MQKPIARVTGYHAGRCVIEPTNPSEALPTGLALFACDPDAQSETAKLNTEIEQWKAVYDTQNKEIAKRDARIAELEADQDKANAAVAIGNYLGKTYNYAWCNTSLASQTIDLLKEQSAEIWRLKALVDTCKSVIDDALFTKHNQSSLAFLRRNMAKALGAIKKEGL